MALHWHAYSFNLHGSEIKDDKGREETPGFATLEHPANRLSAYLRKSSQLIRGTFHDPDSAVDWFLQEYRKLPRLMTENTGALGYPDDEDKLARNRETLARGQDLAWSFWVVGVRRIDLRMISCPNQRDTTAPCPTSRTANLSTF